jgi:hypothetical protein
MQSLGVIEAVNGAAAIEEAVVLFSLDDERRKRLAVNLRGKASPARPRRTCQRSGLGDCCCAA